MGILIAQPPRVPTINTIEPIKTAHECAYIFKRNTQYPKDANILKAQAQTFAELNRDLNDAINSPPGYDREQKITRLVENWRTECANFYARNTWLPHVFREIFDEEYFVLKTIDKVPEDVLEFRDVDYKEEQLIKKVKETAEGFRRDIMLATDEAYRQALKFGQRLGKMVPDPEGGPDKFENIKLEIAPLPETLIRHANYLEIAYSALVLTAKKTYDFLLDHKLLIPILISSAVVALQTDLNDALRPTVETMAEGAKISTHLFADAIPALADTGITIFERLTKKSLTPFVGAAAVATWAIPMAFNAFLDDRYWKSVGVVLLGAACSTAPYFVKPGFISDHIFPIAVASAATGAAGLITKIAARYLPDDHPGAKNFLSLAGDTAFIGAALAGDIVAGKKGYIMGHPCRSIAVAGVEALAFAYLSEKGTKREMLKIAAGALFSVAGYKKFGLAAGIATAALSAGAYVSNWVSGLRHQVPRDPAEIPQRLIDGPNPRYTASETYKTGAWVALPGLLTAAVVHIGAQTIKDNVQAVVGTVASTLKGNPMATTALAVGTAALAIGTVIGTATGLITRERTANAAKAIGRGAVSHYTTGAAVLVGGAAVTGFVKNPWVAAASAGIVLINGSYHCGRGMINVIRRCFGGV